MGAGDRTGMGVQLMGKLAFVTARIEQANKACLAAWLRELPLDLFASRCVRPVQYYLASLAQRQVSLFAKHGNNQCLCSLCFTYVSQSGCALRGAALQLVCYVENVTCTRVC